MIEELYNDLGQLTPEAEERMHDESASQAIKDGEDLIALNKHPGWVLIRETLEATIAKDRHMLLFARAMEMVTRLQESIRARQELLDFIQIKILESKHLLEESTKAQAPI